MSDKVKEWEDFSRMMALHITSMGRKYDTGSVSCADIQTWEGPLNDAFKYLWEILVWVKSDSWDMEDMKKNLLKSAHCSQIAHTKLGAKEKS